MNPQIKLNDLGYFETRGLNVLVFSNWYDGNFSDAKISGVELIHHEVRTATNGDVRLSPTPGQWDAAPNLIGRAVNTAEGSIETSLAYPDYEFQYTIKAEARDEGILLSVNLERPLPPELEGRAGLNMEFLPSAYFRKAYLMDGQSGIFPRYPSGPMAAADGATPEPKPFATGRTLVLAPEDPARRVAVRAIDSQLLLFDGRNTAQNGWFVLRSALPAGRSGRVVEWLLSASTLPNWVRPPVIAHSQVGYHPDQQKIAIIELDQNDQQLAAARLLKVTDGGELLEHYSGQVSSWGKYLRYSYASFDFTSVREAGL